MISYAQNFEDVLLWRALQHIEKGFYLDIGAQDPIVDSVSKAFYDAGWRGVHVDAAPAYAARLRENRPEELVIEAAIAEKRGLISFFEIADTGLSTADRDIADHHLTQLGRASREIVVPAITLADVFEQIGERDIHWMKIDVEGFEPAVIRSWGEASQRPWILVIESTFPGSQTPTHDEWIDQVLSRGYSEVYFDGLSRFFVSNDHTDLARHFDKPVNVFDEFTLSLEHHLARLVRWKVDDHHIHMSQAREAQWSRERASLIQEIADKRRVEDEQSTELARVTAVARELQGSVTALDRHIEHLTRQTNDLSGQLSDRQNRVEALTAALDEQRALHAELSANLQTSETTLTRLRTSLSWRITAPIRKIGRAMGLRRG